ncbi:hypothetical protein RD1_3074 [Roseobacter denitrificans OCh 114]|uniref:Uncharacterized protein n=1 Tax=Roseobacter denitrificans (strain ATCC 33942 / OCh 114) TaxID=375451 RepID=Q164K8_ROSDO|nr:hypothetical protein RD1_3074 [Roseobacter denitrificans OCh 114]
MAPADHLKRLAKNLNRMTLPAIDDFSAVPDV